MRENSGVITVAATIEGFSNLIRNAIFEKLGNDKEALKAFDVKLYQPTTQAEADDYAELGKRLFVVNGALGLDDSGIKMRAFSFMMEEGLSHEDDMEIAAQAAHQCLKCVAQLKRERSKPTLVAV